MSFKCDLSQYCVNGSVNHLPPNEAVKKPPKKRRATCRTDVALDLSAASTLHLSPPAKDNQTPLPSHVFKMDAHIHHLPITPPTPPKHQLTSSFPPSICTDSSTVLIISAPNQVFHLQQAPPLPSESVSFEGDRVKLHCCKVADQVVPVVTVMQERSCESISGCYTVCRCPGTFSSCTGAVDSSSSQQVSAINEISPSDHFDFPSDDRNLSHSVRDAPLSSSLDSLYGEVPSIDIGSHGACLQIATSFQASHSNTSTFECVSNNFVGFQSLCSSKKELPLETTVSPFNCKTATVMTAEVKNVWENKLFPDGMMKSANVSSSRDFIENAYSIRGSSKLLNDNYIAKPANNPSHVRSRGKSKKSTCGRKRPPDDAAACRERLMRIDNSINTIIARYVYSCCHITKLPKLREGAKETIDREMETRVRVGRKKRVAKHVSDVFAVIPASEVYPLRFSEPVSISDSDIKENMGFISTNSNSQSLRCNQIEIGVFPSTKHDNGAKVVTSTLHCLPNTNNQSKILADEKANVNGTFDACDGEITSLPNVSHIKLRSGLRQIETMPPQSKKRKLTSKHKDLILHLCDQELNVSCEMPETSVQNGQLENVKGDVIHSFNQTIKSDDRAASKDHHDIKWTTRKTSLDDPDICIEADKSTCGLSDARISSSLTQCAAGCSCSATTNKHSLVCDVVTCLQNAVRPTRYTDVLPDMVATNRSIMPNKDIDDSDEKMALEDSRKVDFEKLSVHDVVRQMSVEWFDESMPHVVEQRLDSNEETGSVDFHEQDAASRSMLALECGEMANPCSSVSKHDYKFGEIAHSKTETASVTTQDDIATRVRDSRMCPYWKDDISNEECIVHADDGDPVCASVQKKARKTLDEVICPDCGHRTRGQAALSRHMKKMHEKSVVLPYPCPKCPGCAYSASRLGLLARHMLTHQLYMCSRCQFTVGTKEEYEEHLHLQHNVKLDCKLCKKCNHYVKCGTVSLEQHVASCPGPVPFTCDVCGKQFKYDSSLKVHRQTHFPEQPRLYCCAKCDYSSNYRANLHKHTQNIHVERARVLPCTICDKLFSTDDNLRRHAKLHAQVCSYRCNRCEKTFKSQAALRCHTASHDVVRPYRCNIGDCQREFRIAKFLKSHQEEFHRLIPKKYHCTVSGCGFSFFKISHLKRHEISHTGARNFHCPHDGCGKSFRHSDNLKVHSRQHGNERPLTCTHCVFTCRQKSSLLWHIKKEHGSVMHLANILNEDDERILPGADISLPEGSLLPDSIAIPVGIELLPMVKEVMVVNSNDSSKVSVSDAPQLPLNDGCVSARDLYEFHSDSDSCDEAPLGVFKGFKARKSNAIPLPPAPTELQVRHGAKVVFSDSSATVATGSRSKAFLLGKGFPKGRRVSKFMETSGDCCSGGKGGCVVLNGVSVKALGRKKGSRKISCAEGTMPSMNKACAIARRKRLAGVSDVKIRHGDDISRRIFGNAEMDSVKQVGDDINECGMKVDGEPTKNGRKSKGLRKYRNLRVERVRAKILDCAVSEDCRQHIETDDGNSNVVVSCDGVSNEHAPTAATRKRHRVVARAKHTKIGKGDRRIGASLKEDVIKNGTRLRNSRFRQYRNASVDPDDLPEEMSLSTMSPADRIHTKRHIMATRNSSAISEDTSFHSHYEVSSDSVDMPQGAGSPYSEFECNEVNGSSPERTTSVRTNDSHTCENEQEITQEPLKSGNFAVGKSFTTNEDANGLLDNVDVALSDVEDLINGIPLTPPHAPAPPSFDCSDEEGVVSFIPQRGMSSEASVAETKNSTEVKMPCFQMAASFQLPSMGSISLPLSNLQPSQNLQSQQSRLVEVLHQSIEGANQHPTCDDYPLLSSSENHLPEYGLGYFPDESACAKYVSSHSREICVKAKSENNCLQARSPMKPLPHSTNFSFTQGDSLSTFTQHSREKHCSGEVLNLPDDFHQDYIGEYSCTSVLGKCCQKQICHKKIEHHSYTEYLQPRSCEEVSHSKSDDLCEQQKSESKRVPASSYLGHSGVQFDNVILPPMANYDILSGHIQPSSEVESAYQYLKSLTQCGEMADTVNVEYSHLEQMDAFIRKSHFESNTGVQTSPMASYLSVTPCMPQSSSNLPMELSSMPVHHTKDILHSERHLDPMLIGDMKSAARQVRGRMLEASTVNHPADIGCSDRSCFSYPHGFQRFSGLSECEMFPHQRQSIATPFFPTPHIPDRCSPQFSEPPLISTTQNTLFRCHGIMHDGILPSAHGISKSMPLNAFANSWAGRDMHPSHWSSQTPTYLQHTSIAPTHFSLTSRDSYFPSRDFMLESTKPLGATVQKTYTPQSSSQNSRDFASGNAPSPSNRFDLSSYFASNAAYPMAASGFDYGRGIVPKMIENRIHHAGMIGDIRSMPTPSTEMLGSVSSLNGIALMDKYAMYGRDSMYNTAAVHHLSDNTSSPFLSHAPIQSSLFERDYAHRTWYAHQNPVNLFGNERQFSSFNHVRRTADDDLMAHHNSVIAHDNWIARPAVNDSQMIDPYRYSVMNNGFTRYLFD